MWEPGNDATGGVGDPRKIAVVTPQGWIGAEHLLLGIFFLGCGRVAAARGM